MIKSSTMELIRGTVIPAKAEVVYTSDAIRGLALQEFMRGDPGSCYLYSHLFQAANSIVNLTIRNHTKEMLREIHQVAIIPSDHQSNKSGCDIHFPRKTSTL